MTMDEFDLNAWARLTALQFKFNIILSDAMHAYDALKIEYAQLKNYVDFEQDFVIWYDDLHGEVSVRVYTVYDRSGRRRPFHFSVAFCTHTHTHTATP